MKTYDTPLGINLDNAFEQTPAGFSVRVANALQEMKTARTAKKSMRCLLIAAVCLVLVGGGALAAKNLGVLYFLTEMTSMPLDKSVVENSMKKNLSQSFDGKQLMVQARDYVWNDMTFFLALHVAPQDPGKHRLIGVMDFGADGIHLEDIWWENEVTTMDKWLPKGKQALVVDVTGMTLGAKKLLSSVGWVPEERGETFLLEASLYRLTPELYEKLLDENGNIAVSVFVSSWIYGSDAKEESVLQLTVEAPTKEEWRKQYYGE